MAILGTQSNRRPGPFPRRLAACVLGLLWMVCAGISLGDSSAPPSKEYQIKAAFIYNFTKYVEWAPEAFPDKAGPIVIGVLGANPFGSELQNAVEERKVNGRALVIRTVAAPADMEGLHALYVADSETARYGSILRGLRGRPLLTIGETESFMREGGVISFVLEGEKVRFVINMDSAESAGLRISAQLQKLALRIQRKP